MKRISLKFNIIYSIVYQILIVIIPLITSPYVSRRLGAEMSGIYAYTYSIAYYFMMFGRLGIVTYGNRCIARVRDNQEELNRTFCSLVIFQLFFSVITIFLYVMYTFTFAKNNQIIYLIHLTAILANMIDITWFFNGLEEFRITLTRNIIIKIITLFLIFTFVRGKQDLWIYTLIMGGGTLAGQIAMLPYLKNRISFVKPKFSEIMVHFKPNLILFIPSIAISVFTIMDKIMLGMISEMSDVGFYEYAEKIIAVPKGLITALGTAMLPRMTNLLAKGKNDESKKYIRNTMFYVSIISSILVFGLMSVSNVFAPVYWGKEYITSGYLIMILCPSITFSVIGNVVRTQFLIPTARDKEYVSSLVAGAIINFVGNIILIPHLGSVGASISTVMAELLMTSIQIFVSRKNLNFRQYFKDGYKYYIIGFIMFIINYSIGTILAKSIFSLILLLILGGLIYLILFIIILFTSKGEMEQKFKNYIKIKFEKKVKA